MSKFIILLIIISYTLCTNINIKRPTYNEQKLVDCLKEEKIEFDDKVENLRKYYDAERIYMFYKIIGEQKLNDNFKFQLMYCFSLYGLKLPKISNYLNCMDICKDYPENKCNCKKNKMV